jgi:hypothetical protein
MSLASQKLKIHKWEPRTPDDRRPLPVLFEGQVDLPPEHDAARTAARKRALALVPKAKRVCGASALVGGGFAIVVELG